MNGLTLLSGGGGGGGALPTNWASFDIYAPVVLTPGAGSQHAYTGDEISFSDWSGHHTDADDPNDFTLDTSGPQPIIRSTRGGAFQATMMAGSPVRDAGEPPDDPTVVLDAAYQHTRYVWLGVAMGDQDSEGFFGDVGVDMLVPIITGGLEGQNVRHTATSSVGYTPPGGVVMSSFGAALVAGVGDDSVPINRLVGVCCVYQIG
jgi:hypothetical protein